MATTQLRGKQVKDSDISYVDLALGATSTATTTDNVLLIDASNNMRPRGLQQAIKDVNGVLLSGSTANYLTKFSSTGNTIVNSVAYDSGTSLNIGYIPGTEVGKFVAGGDGIAGGFSVYNGTGSTFRMYREGDVGFITRGGNNLYGIRIETNGFVNAPTGLQVGGANVATQAWVTSQNYLTDNAASWGTDATGYRPLTIDGVTENVSTSDHTHTYLLGDSISNLDTIDTSTRIFSYDRYSNGATGQPVSRDNANGVITLSTHTDSNYAHQIAFQDENGAIYTRAKIAGNWASWYKIWNEANDGSSSGLDADLLDGQHGSYYYAASNPSGYQTAAQVSASISALVDSAPTTLDTLNELAAALGDDPNFATTVTNNIGTKVSKSGDTMTGTLTISSTDENQFSAYRNLSTYAVNIGDSNTRAVAKFRASNAGTEQLTISRGVSTMQLQSVLTDGATAVNISLNPFGGDVGVGTNAPAKKLDVIGPIRTSTGQIYGGAGNTLSVYTDANAAIRLRTGGVLVGTSYDSDPNLNEIRTSNNQNLTINSRGTGNLYLQTNDSTKVTVLNNGNVGIGVTTPSFPLTVQRDSADVISWRNSSVELGRLGYSSTTNDGWIGLYSSGSPTIYLRANGNTYFNGGNVGINTTTPQAKLDVNGDVNIKGTLHNTTEVTLNSPYHTAILTIPVASYQAIILDYTVKGQSGTPFRVGSMTVLADSGNITFNEYGVVQIGTLGNDITMEAALNGTNIEIRATGASITYTFKLSYRAL